MATRRNISAEKTDDGIPLSPNTPASGKSNISPAVPTSVIVKLLGFTLAMVCLPLGTYFMTVNSIYSGNSTYAGATAAITANAVLIAYVVVAIREDQSEGGEDAGQRTRKTE